MQQPAPHLPTHERSALLQIMTWHHDSRKGYPKTKGYRIYSIDFTDSALQSISGFDYNGVKDPIVGMTDSDFASGTEKDRRSISGMAFFLFGNLICYISSFRVGAILMTSLGLIP